MNRPDRVDVLLEGEMEIEGRMPWSSNATFLVHLRVADDVSEDVSEGAVDRETDRQSVKAIYKPYKGERPLWDFPAGLYRREVAAYELAVLLGWEIIPRTVLREGPFGIGSVQTFVDADFSEHYFTMMESRPSVHHHFRRMATFDLIANNADRKGGHLLLRAEDDTVWGIDQGLCFNVEPKLRTVLWDFAGEKIPKHLRADVERVASMQPGALGALDELLTDDEIATMLERARRVVDRPFFPHPKSDYAYPWPMV